MCAHLHIVCVWLRQLEDLVSGGTSQLLERLWALEVDWGICFYVQISMWRTMGKSEDPALVHLIPSTEGICSICVGVGLNTSSWSAVVALEVANPGATS